MGCVGIFRRWRRFEGILFQGNILRFQQLEAVFDQFSSRRMLQPWMTARQTVARCVRRVHGRWLGIWVFRMQTMDLQDVEHGASWCRPWRFMVPAIDFHGGDHGFSWCRPWIFMVQTMDFHGADHGFSDHGFSWCDHGFSWCRPWIFMVPTMDFHGADHGFSWCRPWILMVPTMDFQDAHPWNCTLRRFGRDLRPHSLGSATPSVLQLPGRIGVFRTFVGWWRIPKGADEAFFGAQVGKQVGQFDFSGAHQSA